MFRNPAFLMPTILFSPAAWFQPRTAKAVADLCLQQGKELKVKKNSQLLDAGFRAQEVYFIVEGACRLVYYDQDGNDVTMSILLPGRTVGDFSIIVKRPIMFNLGVIKNSTFRVISKAVFLNHLETHPEDRPLIDENVKERYRSYLEGFYSNAALYSETRLSKLLIVLFQEPDTFTKNGYARLPSFLTQELLANVLATNRITIYKLFHKWKEEGRLLHESDGYWVHLERLLPHENPFSGL